MAYTIGYGRRNKKEVSVAHCDTAVEALKLAIDLQRSDEEIKFVDTPEGRYGVEMLRVMAKEEETRAKKT